MATYWTISRPILNRIAAETMASPDREICGLLLGVTGKVDAAIACRNVAADPATRFEIDPAALLAAHRAARTGGAAVIGCYHSHPTGLPEPSPRDAADAAPDGSLWLVATNAAVTAWQAVADGPLHGRFASVVLRVAAAAAK
jgi:proteasome lid subunit RPN8/RPN11